MIDGGSGDDYIAFGSGDDIVHGGDGDDVIDDVKEVDWGAKMSSMVARNDTIWAVMVMISSMVELVTTAY